MVKAFNHIFTADFMTDWEAKGAPNRRALAIAGDNAGAKRVVANLIDCFDFDVLDAGPLSEGWRFQRDTPGYGPRRTAQPLRGDLGVAKRYRVMQAHT